MISLPLIGQEGFVDSTIGVHFPKDLGGIKYQERNTYDQPGLGYSIRYQDESLLKIDIYIYNKNLEEIGTGIESQTVKDEFEATLKIISYMEKQGAYKRVKVIDKRTIQIGQIEYYWARYEYQQAESEETHYLGDRISETYLTGVNNFFIKVRLTYKKIDNEKKKAIKDKFLIGLSDLLSSS